MRNVWRNWLFELKRIQRLTKEENFFGPRSIETIKNFFSFLHVQSETKRDFFERRGGLINKVLEKRFLEIKERFAKDEEKLIEYLKIVKICIEICEYFVGERLEYEKQRRKRRGLFFPSSLDKSSCLATIKIS